MDMSGQDYQMMMMMMMQGGGQMARVRKPPTDDIVRETLRAFVTKYKVKGTHESDDKFEEFYSRLMTTDKFDDQLSAAESLTESLGVTQLPSMFVNGQLYAGEPEIVRQLPYTVSDGGQQTEPIVSGPAHPLKRSILPPTVGHSCASSTQFWWRRSAPAG